MSLALDSMEQYTKECTSTETQGKITHRAFQVKIHRNIIQIYVALLITRYHYFVINQIHRGDQELEISASKCKNRKQL